MQGCRGNLLLEMVECHKGTDIENVANVHMHVKWILFRATDLL